MKTPKAPPAPDPTATANAQQGYNRDAAFTQARLNMVNQVTPTGSLTYEQTGTAADGTPTFTATTKLSDGQQKLYDTGLDTSQTMGSAGSALAKAIEDRYSTPASFDTDAVESHIMDLARRRLDPILAQRTDATRAQLAAEGFQRGSEGYDRALKQDTEGQNDAYTQMILQGHDQAMRDLLTERQQPLSELAAIRGLSGAQMPNFINTPQEQMQPANYAGVVSNNYNNAMQLYGQKMGQNNAMMGGLSGLGGNVLGGWARSGGMSGGMSSLGTGRAVAA
jgi:hypothetical protein